MTLYHPNTDREIIRLHLQGAPDHRIAEDLAVELDYVRKVTRVDINRDHIVQLWNEGVGKREISARLSIPITIVTDTIRTHTAQQRTPRPTTRQERALTGTERLLQRGDHSPNATTRKLAERTRRTLTQLTTALAQEREQQHLAQAVDRAQKALDDARNKLRTRNL
jgi:hypothetical protein